MNLALFFTMGPGAGSTVTAPPPVFVPGGGRVPEERLRRLRRVRRDAEVEVEPVLAFAVLGRARVVLPIDADPEIAGVFARGVLGEVDVRAIQNLSDEELLILLAHTWRSK